VCRLQVAFSFLFSFLIEGGLYSVTASGFSFLIFMAVCCFCYSFLHNRPGSQPMQPLDTTGATGRSHGGRDYGCA